MRERILIVDDQEDVREYLCYTLDALQKYDLLVAENGVDGLKILENEHVDLILIDQQMPGMSGLDMLTNLKDRDMYIPAILATGQGSEETAVTAFRLGVLDYIIKPIDPDELEASVEKALRTTRLERERTELIKELTRNNSNLKQRAREFNVLYGVGRTINAHHTRNTVCHRIVDGAVFAVGAEAGGLVLWSKENSALYIHAVKEKGGEAYTTHRLTDNNLVARAFRTSQPVLVSPELTPKRNGDSVSTSKSSLYVPIFSHGEPIGVLYVTNDDPHATLRQTDTQVLAALADYVALAIHHDNLAEILDIKMNTLPDQKALEDEISNIVT